MKLGEGSCLTNQSNGNLRKNDSVLMPKGEFKLALKPNPAQGRAAAITPRPDEVHSTCNCKGAYVHQMPL